MAPSSHLRQFIYGVVLHKQSAYSQAKPVKHYLKIEGENGDLKELVVSKQCFYIIFSKQM